MIAKRDHPQSPKGLLNCNVTAAAEWITHSGEVLFSLLEDDNAEHQSESIIPGSL